jgi:hypothetical protein
MEDIMYNGSKLINRVTWRYWQIVNNGNGGLHLLSNEETKEYFKARHELVNLSMLEDKLRKESA